MPANDPAKPASPASKAANSSPTATESADPATAEQFTAALNLAIEQFGRGNIAQAMAEARRAIDLDPRSPGGFYTLAVILEKADRLDEAIGAYESALRRSPDMFQARNNLGLALIKKGDYQGAVPHLHHLVRTHPDVADFHLNLGWAYKENFQLDEASAELRKAVALRPSSSDAHFKLAVTRLLAGDLLEGFREFEWRWKFYQESEKTTERVVPGTQWRGEDLRGRTILLHCEQGFGDNIQFIRYAPLVAARGGKVLLESRQELLRLFANLPGVSAVSVAGMPLPRFDLHCPLMSLPLAFATALETIPTHTPYLNADPKLVAEKAPLLRGGGLKVGIVWAGQPKYKNDPIRSIAAELLAPLATIPNVNWFGLQKGMTAGQMAAVPFGDRLTDLGEGLRDFADTAAVMASLDLVIAVDTSVAHLAGALGRPVWILLPYDPDWRWLLNRDDSPWYPTARLFRQPRRGDWDAVIASVAQALRERAGGVAMLTP